MVGRRFSGWLARKPRVSSEEGEPQALARVFRPAHVEARDPASARDTAAPILLGRCLSFGLTVADLQRLRLELFRGPEAWGDIFTLAEASALLPALADRLQALGLIPPAGRQSNDGVEQPGDVLRATIQRHRAYRTEFGEQLLEVLKVWKAAGIEPLLIKGARSLWIGEPGWRYMVDLDLLVLPGELERAKAALVACSYHELKSDTYRPRVWSHHIAPLVRDDRAAMIELHKHAANRYAEHLLPTAELWQESTALEVDGVRARVLPEVLHLLHGLLHYHVGHRGDVDGVLGIRGLYEFAWSFSRLDADGRARLFARASRNLRIATALDIWLAAASNLFALPVPEPFRVHADALARWHRIAAAETKNRASHVLSLYADEIELACHPERLHRAGWGHLPFRTLLARLSVIGSIARSKLPGQFL